MALNVDDVFAAMMAAGKTVLADNWVEISAYADSEFKKMATQIVAIGENVAKHEVDPTQGYSAEAGKILLNMQRLATVNVLTGMTTMTAVTAQQALDAIMGVVKKTIGGVVAGILSARARPGCMAPSLTGSLVLP